MDEFESWYQQYAPMVYRRCHGLLGHEQDALDVTQQVFIKLLEHKGKIDAPASYLYRVATNLCLNHIRAHTRYQNRLAQSKLWSIATYEEMGAMSARSTLGRLFGLTQESTRCMAVMHYIDGMTLEQVAQSVGLSVSGVRKRLGKLKAQLQWVDGECV